MSAPSKEKRLPGRSLLNRPWHLPRRSLAFSASYFLAGGVHVVSAPGMCRCGILADPGCLTGCVWEKSENARALECVGQSPLVLGARARLAARLDLAAVRHEAAKPADILVIDLGHVVHAERADLPPVIAAVVTAWPLS